MYLRFKRWFKKFAKQPFRIKHTAKRERVLTLVIATVLLFHATHAFGLLVSEILKEEPVTQVISAPIIHKIPEVKALVSPEEPMKRELPTQYQKDAVATACRKVGENRSHSLEVQQVSLELFLDTCFHDVLSVAYTESRFYNKAVGDQNRSRGSFQIQTKLHGITVEQAEDFAWSAEWVVGHLMSNSFPKFRTFALKRFNGSGVMAQLYAERVKKTSDRFRAMGL